MKRLFVSLAIASLMAASTAAIAPAQEAEQDQEAMMKAYMEVIKPGQAHQMLASLEGKWDYVMHSYEDPDNPMEIKGTSSMTMVMGGRYLMQETEGAMMGMAFTGMGVTGFNNATKKFESIWYDNMGTGIMKSVGEADNDIITMYSEHVDPMTLKSSKVNL